MKFDKSVKILWKDTKRIMGMPISFTHYYLVQKPDKWTKLIEKKGFMHTEVEEVLVYRIDDLGVFESLGNKIFGVGNVDVHCDDASVKVLRLKNIANPMKVKNLLNDLVEEERARRKVHYSEIQR